MTRTHVKATRTTPEGKSVAVVGDFNCDRNLISDLPSKGVKEAPFTSAHQWGRRHRDVTAAAV